jgi:hypothetical protein
VFNPLLVGLIVSDSLVNGNDYFGATFLFTMCLAWIYGIFAVVRLPRWYPTSAYVGIGFLVLTMMLVVPEHVELKGQLGYSFMLGWFNGMGSTSGYLWLITRAKADT